jgi:uncharacterized protein involved in outer membrane biogenesis
MLLGSGNARGRRARVRGALHSAREVYRRHTAKLPERLPAKRVVRNDDPDVVLDIPQVKVDEIDLELDELKARVALEAHVLELLKLDVGVDASLGRVALKITGVEAQAQLKVRLDNLATILDRVMTTVDRNPQILEQLTRGVGEAVGDVGSAVEEVGKLPSRLAGGDTEPEK